MNDLESLIDQEHRLQFDRFDHTTAWQLGQTLKQLAEARQASVAIEIYAFGQVLFLYAMPGTTQNHLDWLRRKRQATLYFGRSSLYLGVYNRNRQRELERLPHIDPREFSSQGGAFPIRLRGSGVLGTVSVSGLPQENDHGLVVDALERLVA